MPERSSRRPRICVVDDDPSVLALMSALLESEYEVLTARNGRDASRMVRLDPPDLILLDLQMPDLDGFSVCRCIRDDALTADVPIIFLTVYNDEATEVRGLSMGADDFIAKPPSGPVLLARVRNLIRLKQANDRLKREARSDGLTGLANRRHFMSVLHDEWLRAKRQDKPLSALMLDVDHFKAFNDHYGHLAGDGALVRVGHLLHHIAKRPGDLPARLGGEEFALLLPDTDSAGALALAHRVLVAMRAAGIAHAASPVSSLLSVSIGVATCRPNAGGTLDRRTDMAPLQPDVELDLMARADAALYLAKGRGRNQACADPDPECTEGADL